MDDSGDMLATPLSKLPPPVMQSRADEPQQGGGTAGSAPNYADVMKDFSNTSRGAEYDPRPPSQAPSHTGHMEEYEPMQQQYTPQPQYQQQQQMHQYAPQPQYQQHNPLAYAMPAPTYTSPPPIALPPSTPKKKILSLETLKSTRAWFAAIVIFLFVMYALPKIKASIPALVSPLTGELSVPGVAAASAVAGLTLATISDHFITS
jgi:hypothetical protein